ncbi:hypothetical protein, conserved [Eimeria tenella]|uniref:Uncharacterized protein n=1 Tax=Eimeria tenella TaxID=5802 RepID=U6KNV1_EIMTE|nr:hypothetical protein, conserved [Eimeria tenella]CDJ38496.1 hypothetical protein, conserved [Eimeria tenella]|eukprot:XP_013229334.1 hypothetical protein, conserved [Eimeria tenella]
MLETTKHVKCLMVRHYLCSVSPQALNQTVLDAGDSAFVASTYQRKRLYYLLEQQKTRREARDALKNLEKLHGEFRVAIKQRRNFSVSGKLRSCGSIEHVFPETLHLQ